MDYELEEQSTLYDLLCDGVEVGDIVEAIEQGRVRMIDRFGRDNQVPKGKDLDGLLDQLEHHEHMILFKGVPYQISPYDTEEYWRYVWPLMDDYMPGIAPPILRSWLVDDQKKNNSKSKSSDSGSKIGSELADKRWAKHKVLCDEVREMAIPLISRDNLLHNEIARDLNDTSELAPLSLQIIMREVAAQCYAMGHNDLVRGQKKPK